MIVFSNVSKTYPNGVQALKDVKLTINDGEFVAIIGLSGAGKSTLLRSINKMHEISEGSILTIASSMWSWELLGTILLAVIIMVMLVDFISSSLRKKLV